MAEPRARTAAPLSVARIFLLLQKLAASGSGASLSELAQELDAPITSVLGLVRGLIEQGYVTREGRTYRLGSESYILAGRILARQNVGQVARPALAALAAATGESAGLALLSSDRSEMVYTEFVSGPNPIRFETTVGERHPLHEGPGGRLMLSLLPDDRIESHLARMRLTAATAATVTDKRKLKSILAAARRDLFTATFGENVEGAAAFAAPVFDRYDAPIGAVLLIGPIARMRAGKAAFSDLTVRAGKQVSALLGASARPWTRPEA
jgi:DNA-binding IclR family transcriptional regulator